MKPGDSFPKDYDAKMFRYAIRRCMQMLVTIFIGATIVFFVFTTVPGDPAMLYAGEQPSQEYVDKLRHEFGLDQPIGIQYGNFLLGLINGKLGYSYFTSKPVAPVLIRRTVNSFKLSAVAITFAVLVGVPAGMAAALKRGSPFEILIRGAVILGISLPAFWLALLLILLFSVHWNILPAARLESWQSYVMPALVLSAFSTAFIARMTSSLLLEVNLEDYIRTAYAKGLPGRVVVLKHALKNVLIPLVTLIGMRFGYMLTGAVVTETVFAWPGLGRMVVEAIGQRDFPFIRGCFVVTVLVFSVLNLLTDLGYAFLDPRVRYK